MTVRRIRRAHRASRRTARVGLAVAALALAGPLLVACGGGSSGSSSATTGAASDSAGTAKFSAAGSCTAEPREALGLDATWKVCADNGFDPATDTFSFENYDGPVAGDAITVDTAVQMFGAASVCVSAAAATCQPTPAAQQWIDQANQDIAGGRCEGLAVISQRIREGREQAASLQDGAAHTLDLQKDAVKVASSIGRWWATQDYPEVEAAAAAVRDKNPAKVAEGVAAAIAAKQGATIGIYFTEGGHALTPVAVAWDGGATYRIVVYDSNFPATLKFLDVDTKSKTWSYPDAQLNPNTPGGAVEGGKGTLDYTLMSWRETARVAPWLASGSAKDGKGSTLIDVSTSGSAVVDLRITDGSDTFLASSLLTSPRTGYLYLPNRDAATRFGTGGRLKVPNNRRTRIVPIVGRRLDGAAGTTRLRLLVDQPGPASILARAEADPAAGAEDLLSIDLDTTGSNLDVSIDPNGVDADLEFVSGDDRYDFTVPGRGRFVVDDADTQDGYGLTVEGDDGIDWWTRSFDDDFGDAGAVWRDIDFGDDNQAVIDDRTPDWSAMDEAAWNALYPTDDPWSVDEAESDSAVPDDTTGSSSTEPIDTTAVETTAPDTTAPAETTPPEEPPPGS